ncbi:MAG: ABC transporter ATP-binding protein/permease [Gammaproteobacteria bacterium]|nr:ABC transporter ATP-binding protein/permease [Gammaproteobacteria bacterium]
MLEKMLLQGWYGWDFFKRFWRIFRPYWASEEKRTAYGLLVLITLGIVLQVRLNVAFNHFYQVFYDALQSFDSKVIVLQLLKFCVLVTASLLLLGYTAYWMGELIIRWRRWLTFQYLGHWFGKNNYYRLEVLNLNVDNPDQRISEDLNLFPSLTVQLYSAFLHAILNLISFSIILWDISGTPKFHLFHWTILFPGYLCWTALIYAALGTFLTAKIGHHLASLNYMQQQYNANFRFGLARIREFNEQIALFHGRETEKKSLIGTFSFVFNNFIRIIKVQRNLDFFRGGYSIVSGLIGVCAALPLYLARKIKMGVLMQISNAFGQVIDSLSIFINAFNEIANWYSVIYRLTEFEMRMKLADKHEALEHISIVSVPKQTFLQCKDVTITLPSQQPLLTDFNLTIEQGERLLIMGNSGSGKSTLLRFIAGIWPYGQGEVTLPEAKMLFLPQKPYFPLGTLRAAVCYPSDPDMFSEQDIVQALCQCGLTQYSENLMEVKHWSQSLSLGEQQLLAFARVLLHKPDWLFLDEATSAMDEANERRMYEYVDHCLSPTVTVVSVGHRPSLIAWHHRKLLMVKGREAVLSEI